MSYFILIPASYLGFEKYREHFLQITDYLISIGAEIDLQKDFGMTALMWAEQPAIVKSLLAAGANTSLQNIDGDDVFDVVIYKGQVLNLPLQYLQSSR